MFWKSKNRGVEAEKPPVPGLLTKVGSDTTFSSSQVGEEAWIEVVQKMDEVYAELVNTQVQIEQKNVELEEAQTFIGSVLSSMTDVLIVCDRNGNIQQVNTALLRFVGKSERSLIGQPLTSLFVLEGEPLNARLADHIKNDTAISDCQVSLCDAAGASIPLSVNCSSRYDSKGRSRGMVVIGRPVGEIQRAYSELDKAHVSLRQAQQQLIFSEKMAALGRLVAGVAHELNNPISFVYGNMHALKKYGEKITHYFKVADGNTDPVALSQLRETLKIDKIINDISPLVEGTLEGAERVSDIVQELRRFSATQKEPEEAFNLLKVVETATGWVLRGAKIKPKVTIDCPSGLMIKTHKGHIHQIIVNLAQNAVDILSGRSDPRLAIHCRAEGEGVIITVHDNGSGILEKDIPHIFEPFYTTKPIGQGTGLGLYVSYSLAEELGATLVGGNHSDGGALFTLTLPPLAMSNGQERSVSDNV